MPQQLAHNVLLQCSPWLRKIPHNNGFRVNIRARRSLHVEVCTCPCVPSVTLPDKWSWDVCGCVWGLSLALSNIGPRCYFITDWQLWQKPWHRNLFSKGSVDSSGIIRINAKTRNKEMSHHNADRLFISILCFTRWISWVIMGRPGCRSPLFVMTDVYTASPRFRRQNNEENRWWDIEYKHGRQTYVYYFYLCDVRITAVTGF